MPGTSSKHPRVVDACSGSGSMDRGPPPPIFASTGPRRPHAMFTSPREDRRSPVQDRNLDLAAFDEFEEEKPSAAPTLQFDPVSQPARHEVAADAAQDRKSVVEGKSVDLG